MKRVIVLVVLTCLGGGLAGCGGGPSKEACRAAIQQQWTEALGNPTTGIKGSRPAACEGISDDVIRQLVIDVMSSPVAAG